MINKDYPKIKTLETQHRGEKTSDTTVRIYLYPLFRRNNCDLIFIGTFGLPFHPETLMKF